MPRQLFAELRPLPLHAGVADWVEGSGLHTHSVILTDKVGMGDVPYSRSAKT